MDAQRPPTNLRAQIEEPPIAAEPRAEPGEKPRGRGKPKSTPPPRDADGGGAPPRAGARKSGEIYDNCPVTPLGVSGATCYYLDVHGQLRGVVKHDQGALMQLWGHRIPSLCWHFPQWAKVAEDEEPKRKKDRFDAVAATMAMVQACSEKGLFDPEGAVRGVGAWRDDDGRLVYHLGKELLIGGERKPPGTYQGRIYPAYPPIPQPALMPTVPDPAAEVLQELETWHWERPDIDAMAALGMVGVQMLGGALDWRPVTWLTGGAATGKSQLQNLLKLLHGGDKGLIASPDATKSGITSLIRQSSLPVALDELEPGDENSRRETDIIMLARIASSGGQWVRGSSDQKGASGNVYSTFTFSSILIPGALKAQDRQRIIILSLKAFPDGTPPRPLRAETWRARGAAIKQLLIDRWPSWSRRLELWREALAEVHIGGRNGDNWATTLAMADAMLHEDQPSAEMLTGWARKLQAAHVVEPDEIGNDAQDLLIHLLSQPYDVYRRGMQPTVAQWLMIAGELTGAPSGIINADADAGPREKAQEANKQLARAGMRVMGKGPTAELFLANSAIQGLLNLFANSQWKGGAWSQSARRVPGATICPTVLSLAGIKTRGTLIPFSSIPGLAYLPMDRGMDAPHTPTQSGGEEFA